MCKRKYVITEETKILKSGQVLHRIKAVRSFGTVKCGHMGGWIEKESNLSHEGNAWVHYNAMAYGDARVYGDACVSGNAQIFEKARVFEEAKVFGNAKVYGEAWIYGDSLIYDLAEAYGEAMVSDYAAVFGFAKVFGEAGISGDTQVFGSAKISCCGKSPAAQKKNEEQRRLRKAEKNQAYNLKQQEITERYAGRLREIDPELASPNGQFNYDKFMDLVSGEKASTDGVAAVLAYAQMIDELHSIESI